MNNESLDDLREELVEACFFAMRTIAPVFQENMWITDYDDGEAIGKMASAPWGALARFAQWIQAVNDCEIEEYDFYENDFEPQRKRLAMMLADLTMVALTYGESWYALDELASWDLGFISDAAGKLLIESIYKNRS